MMALIVLWWRWATDTGGSVLGQTDYTETIRQFTRCVKDGGRLVMEAPVGRPKLSLTRCSDHGEVVLELRLLGAEIGDDQIEELRRDLELLHFPFALKEPSGGADPVFRMTNGFSDRGGRIVDLALSVAGLRPGDVYSQRFEGEFDEQADLQYLRELNEAARDLAETRLQRSVFERILRHLK